MTIATDISDHAVLRYMERVLGIDVEHYRNCVREETRGLEQYNGVVYINGISWLYIKGVLVSVMIGKIKYGQFKDHYT